MAGSKADDLRNFRVIQILVAIFSLIFFIIIANGYANLLGRYGIFLSVAGGTLLALLAWFLARVIGSGLGGPRGAILFVPLFVVSGAGVYNSLMLNLEGSQIVSDSITASEEQLQKLQVAVEHELNAQGAVGRTNRVNALKESLLSEIRNPVNCGQGPEANRIIDDLRRELPGFTPLSMPNSGCAKAPQIIADYEERIGELLERDPKTRPDLRNVVGQASSMRADLERLRADATTNYSPSTLPGTVKTLEELDAKYRDVRFRASRSVPVDDLPATLPVDGVQSLGNAAKLMTLFADRIGKPATWAYLFVAAVFDLLMVYLFWLARNKRVHQVVVPDTIGGGL